MRAMWTGFINFGLVAIPVKAIPAQDPKDVRFELLHAPCLSKLVMRRRCGGCREEAAAEELVRGFAVAPGRYVLIAPEELDGLGTPAKHTFQVLDFVDMAEVDPVW